MNSSLEKTPLLKDIKNILFQPVRADREPSYLIYLAPEGENEGYFKQEEGGVVWFSKNFPDGEPCITRLLSKELGDTILEQIKRAPEQTFRKIER